MQQLLLSRCNIRIHIYWSDIQNMCHDVDKHLNKFQCFNLFFCKTKCQSGERNEKHDFFLNINNGPKISPPLGLAFASANALSCFTQQTPDFLNQLLFVYLGLE